VFLMALWPLTWWLWQLVPALVLFWATFHLALPWRTLLRRAVIVWLMSGLVALGLLGQPNWALRAGNLVLKSTLSLWAVSLLAHCTSVPELAAGLRHLRLPRVVTETFAFWARYYAVLGREWQRLELAREARTIEATPRRRFRMLANALGLLFIRAYERAEKVHQAMLARGYRGD
jgi:cobalt/nickel transport system permease protein